MPLTASDIEKLIPHSGSMCLLNSVLDWNQQSLRCAASSHRDIQNPLRNEAGLSSIYGIEYAAQSMAIHGALLDKNNAGRQGLLLSVKDINFTIQRLDDIAHDLIIDAEMLIADNAMFSYKFCVSANGVDLVSGKATALFLGIESP